METELILELQKLMEEYREEMKEFREEVKEFREEWKSQSLTFFDDGAGDGDSHFSNPIDDGDPDDNFSCDNSEVPAGSEIDEDEDVTVIDDGVGKSYSHDDSDNDCNCDDSDLAPADSKSISELGKGATMEEKVKFVNHNSDVVVYEVQNDAPELFDESHKKGKLQVMIIESGEGAVDALGEFLVDSGCDSDAIEVPGSTIPPKPPDNLHILAAITDNILNLPTYPNSLRFSPVYSVAKQYFVDVDDTVPQRVAVHKTSPRGIHFRCVGPHQMVYFVSDKVHACMVTCGGLCPGLNKVIHKRGGTVIGTSRGGNDTAKIVDSIQDQGINQVHIIRGARTQRGAAVVYEEIRRHGLKVVVAGILKTIDNDIPVLDKSFGFDTAVEEDQRAINVAHVEAGSTENGIGVVKFMGCYSGFIAVYPTLASRAVDLCVIPESPFYLEGEGGLFEYVEKRRKDDGLTRENVGSHFQKYRLYLQGISSVASQQANMVAALGGKDASYLRVGAFEEIGMSRSDAENVCYLHDLADTTRLVNVMQSSAGGNSMVIGAGYIGIGYGQLTLEKGGIKVNGHMQSSNISVYAVGDVACFSVQCFGEATLVMLSMPQHDGLSPGRFNLDVKIFDPGGTDFQILVVQYIQT